MSEKLTITRSIAYDSFIQVIHNGRNPDKVVEELILENKANIRRLDRNFIKELLYGGLRWFSKIHWIIKKTSDRKIEETSPEVQASLILGAYQIFYMDKVPDRAAVNESVEYIRSRKQAHAVKYINGILRTISRRSEYFVKPDKEKYPVEFLSLQFAHPKWIVSRWFSRFGFDRMKTLLFNSNQKAPILIRLNLLKVSFEETQNFRNLLLKKEKIQSYRKPLRSCLKLSSFPSLGADSLFQQGYFSIQGESSQLISRLVQPQAGEHIIDACCGPGGKLAQLYELTKGEAHFIAIDPKQEQVVRAKQTFKRLGHTKKIEWIIADFTQYKPKKSVNKILLDAPCSGLGVLCRHPEGKWQKKESIIYSSQKKQEKLLRHALELVSLGGEVVYSVCSFEPEETIYHLDWILEEFQDKIEVVSILERLPSFYRRFVTKDNILLIYSGNKDGMDGFGAFIIRKKKDLKSKRLKEQ